MDVLLIYYNIALTTRGVLLCSDLYHSGCIPSLLAVTGVFHVFCEPVLPRPRLFYGRDIHNR